MSKSKDLDAVATAPTEDSITGAQLNGALWVESNPMDDLLYVREELKVPKNHHNKFGDFNYRNMEDILMAAKPICASVGAKLLINDEILLVGETLPVTTGQRTDAKGNPEDFVMSAPRFYVKTTATFVYKNGDQVSAAGFAREPVDKKGMDDSQLTGTASSYAGKRALGNLFLLDDLKDSDDLPAPEDDEIAKFLDWYDNEDIFQIYMLKMSEYPKYQALLRVAPPKGKLSEYRRRCGELTWKAYEQAGEWAKTLTTLATKGDKDGIAEYTQELDKQQKQAVWIQLPEAIKRKISDLNDVPGE